MANVNIKEIEEIISHFPFNGNIVEVKCNNTGLINTSYVVVCSDGNLESKYILQKINTNVFKNPDELMSNIMNVTSYLRNIINLNGGNPQRETLTFLYTNDNAPYYRDINGECWRSYNYIDKSYTCDCIDSYTKAFRSGKAFGHFQKLLSNYPSDTLFETIPNFHNTPDRYRLLKEAIENNLSGRIDNVKEEIEFALSREADTSKLIDMLKSGELPLRVTHNDTKINNVLFDSITNEAFCVIDLDTIMPGLSLYDFGDAIRSSATTADENEKNLNNYGLDMELFKGYTDGFLSESWSALTENEIKNLSFSAKLLSLECGVRFLTDYLNGDTYFKTEYPNHNLVRCRTQFKLVREVEDKIDELDKIVTDIYLKYSKQ